MSAVPDSELRAHAANAKGKVVIITGGAGGLGRQCGLDFARAGAKIVIGDLNMKMAAETVAEFKQLGASDAVATKANVTVWSEVVDLFKFAISTFGQVDIVIANAGVGEIGRFEPPGEVVLKSVPSKPPMLTFDVNEIGVIYTAKAASFYLRKSKSSQKSLVLLGSMASWSGISMGPMYTTSKHAVLGLTRALTEKLPSDIRVAMINPWFAATNIVEPAVKILLRGQAYTPVPRVGSAIFHAATDSDPATNGSAYVIPDDGYVHRVSREDLASLSPTVYAGILARLQSQVKTPQGVPCEL